MSKEFKERVSNHLVNSISQFPRVRIMIEEDANWKQIPFAINNYSENLLRYFMLAARNNANPDSTINFLKRKTKELDFLFKAIDENIVFKSRNLYCLITILNLIDEKHLLNKVISKSMGYIKVDDWLDAKTMVLIHLLNRDLLAFNDSIKQLKSYKVAFLNYFDIYFENIYPSILKENKIKQQDIIKAEEVFKDMQKFLKNDPSALFGGDYYTDVVTNHTLEFAKKLIMY